MVSHALRMRKAPGSNPGTSTIFLILLLSVVEGRKEDPRQGRSKDEKFHLVFEEALDGYY